MEKNKITVGLAALSLAGSAQADYALNLTRGVTQLSRDIYDLHMYILWVCVAIGIGVYGLIVYSVMNHRKSLGVVPATFHENTKLEVVWTLIPFLILFAMAVPATKVMIEAYDTSASDMTVKVTGYQWMWRYTYLDDGIDFFSRLDDKSNAARQLGSKINPETVDHYLLNVDHPLVVPAHKKIRFVFTAADVIHSWWVPALGWKKDTIPGFVTEAWARIDEPGTYRGQCAELCGRDHGFMPIVVEAKSEDDYKTWVAAQKAQNADKKQADQADTGRTLALSELMSKGEAVYNTNCAACHQAKGEGIPGTFPAIKGSPVALGPIEDHLEVVAKGKGPMMPAFAHTLSKVDIAAVVTFQRNAFGNDKGDMLQPSQVPSDD